MFVMWVLASLGDRCSCFGVGSGGFTPWTVRIKQLVRYTSSGAHAEDDAAAWQGCNADGDDAHATKHDIGPWSALQHCQHAKNNQYSLGQVKSQAWEENIDINHNL